MAGQKISSMYVEIGADTGDLEKGLKQVEKELGKVAKEFYASAESLNKFGNTSAAAQEALKKLDAEFALGKMSQDKYREGLEAVKRGAGLVSDKSLAAAREIKKLTSDFAGGKITAEQYAASVGKVQSSLTTATKAHMSFGEAIVVANQAMQLAEQVAAKVGQAYNATVGEAMNYNRAMMDLSQNIGMSIEETSRLVQVADDFTVSQEAVTSAMQMMVKRGLAPSIGGLADIADQYVKIKDPVKQAALMTELLGRNWTALTPMLKEGGQAIRDNAAAQSDALIVTEEMAKKTRELEIAQDNFNDSILAIKLSLGNGLIPAVTETLDNFDFFSKSISGTLTEEEKFNNAIRVSSKYFGENSKAVEVAKKGLADYLALKQQTGLTVSEKTLRANMAEVSSLNKVDQAMVRARDGLRAYAEAAQTGGQASKDFAKWIDEGVSAKMIALRTIMAGAIGNENAQYIEQETELKTRAEELRVELEKLNAANGRSYTSTKAASMSENERSAAQAKLGAVTEDLTNQTRKKNETDAEFSSRMADLQVKADGLTEKLSGTTGAVTGYIDNSKKISELTGEYDAVNAEIEANAAKHEDATRRILFGYLQQKIAAEVAEGAMTATEGYDAALTVALQLGIVSVDDATAIGKMGAALDEALFNKNWGGLGAAIKEALNPTIAPPPVENYYANMYDASRKGYKAPEVDTTSIEVAQAKFDALSISTAARNFPIEFAPITKTLTDSVTTAGKTQIALDAINGTKGRDMTVPYIYEIDVTLKNAKTSADYLRESINLIKGKEVDVKVNFLSFGESVSGGETVFPEKDIPARAMGGPVMANQSYMVGERGPELLTMGGMGGYVSPNVNNTVNAPISINAGNGVNINALAAAVSQRIARDLRGANNSGAGYRS